MTANITRRRFRTWRLFWLGLHLVLFVGMYIFALDLGNFARTIYPEQGLYLLWIWPTIIIYLLSTWLLPNWLAMWLGFGYTMWLYYKWAERRVAID